MKTIISCLFILYTGFASGQNNTWYFTGITDTVISITSLNNKIWAATQNAGLKIFDQTTGEITTYNKNNLQVGTNDFRMIRSLNNKIYAGAFFGGLYIYENDSWSWIDTSNSPIPGMNVNDVAFDSVNSILWIATNKGLAKVQNDSWQIFDSTNSELGANDLSCLLNDKNNTLWIGSRFSGVSKLIDGVFTNYNYDNSGLNSNLIRTMISDDEGILYIADFLGVEKYDPVSDVWLFVYNTLTSQLTHNSVNRMAIDAEGNIWFATHNGITKTNATGSWDQFYSTNSNLPHSTTDGLYIDDAGKVWAGTFGGMAIYTSSNQIGSFDDVVNIFPNPCRDLVTISTINPMYISLYSLTGKQLVLEYIMEEAYGEFFNTFNVTSLSKGIYVVECKNENSAISKIFVKN